MPLKADALANILDGAKNAKPVKGKDNVYTPEEYQKVRAKSLAMGLVNDGEYLNAHNATGAVEMQHGMMAPKKIGRNRPAMLDVNRYTANRYKVERVKVGTPGKQAGTFILVAMGEAVVNAIASVNELPPTIRVFRFKREAVKQEKLVKDQKTNEDKTEMVETEIKWVYVGQELMKSEEAYKMTSTLNSDSMLDLIKQIETSGNNTLNGDDLNAIK